MSEVQIIGGGIIGCTIAWRLAQRGARVVISDAGRLGGQSSWAGAGMLAPGGEVDGDSEWARNTVESLRMYGDFVRELTAETGVAIDYRACGAIELAYDDNEVSMIEAKAERQSRIGIVSRAMSREEVAALVPDLDVADLVSARHYPEDAIVDPREVVAALRVALEARGAEIRENTAVQGVPDDAGAVVLAAGAWSSGIVADVPESYPVKGYLVGYDVPAGRLPVILRHGHTYFLQRSSGFLIMGSTTDRVGFDAKVDPSMVARMHARARRYLPGLLRSSPDASWVGFRPGVVGDVPQVRRVGESKLWLAYGHYRNGILLAPLTGVRIAEEVAGS